MLFLLRQGKISKWFSGIGQEAISVGVSKALNSSDVIFPMHRNLGTTDDIRTRDAILTVCSWVYGEKMAFLYHLKETEHWGANLYQQKRRAEEEEEEFEMHQRQRMSFVMKKRFKRTLMEEYVGVILDVSFVKSSFGDEFNGKYVRPVLTLSRRPVDRQRNEELLQRRLTLSKPTESPQVLNKLDRFGVEQRPFYEFVRITNVCTSSSSTSR